MSVSVRAIQQTGASSSYIGYDILDYYYSNGMSHGNAVYPRGIMVYLGLYRTKAEN